MSKRGVLVFTFSLLAGVVAGGLGRPKASLATGEPLVSSPRESRSAARKWRLDDFLTAVRQRPNSSELPVQARCAAVLSLWSEDELRTALDECIYTPASQLSVVSMYLRRELLKAWIARNPEAVLAWFDALNPPTLRSRIAGELSWSWPVEKAEEGFACFLANREVFREQAGYFQRLIIEARGKKGPDAVYAALEQFHTEGITGFGQELKLPEGFDFASLLARDVNAPSGKKDQNPDDGSGSLEWRLIQVWSQQNREQAYDWLLRKKGAAGLNWLWSSSGDKERLQWLPAKIAMLSNEQQGEFLTSARERWFQDMGALKNFAAAAQDPALLEKAQMLAVEGIVYGNIEQSMEVIGTNPEVERRLEILEQGPIGPAPRGRSPVVDGNTTNHMRATLAGWGVEPARIETIVARFSQYELPVK